MKVNNKPSKETSDELQKHNEVHEAKQLYDKNKIDKELDEISKKMGHAREDTTNNYLK